jgi:O-antigen/teichoic acid export membrane protein
MDEIPDLTGQTIKSGGVMFIAKSVRTVFIFVVNIILINLLLPADFGMVRYVMLIVGIADLLCELGLTTAIMQKKAMRNEDLWSLFVVSALWGLLLYMVIFLCAPLASRYFATPELTQLLHAYGLIIPAMSATAVHRAWLRRRMQFGKLAIIEICAGAIAAISSIFMAFAGLGVWALIAGNLVFEGITSILLLTFVRIPLFPLQPFIALRSFFYFGAAVIVSRLIDYLMSNVPLVIIGKSIGTEGLGLFSLANDLATLPLTAFIAVLGDILVSAFSRTQNDPVKTYSGFSRLVLFGSLLSVPALLLMCMMPHELLQVICFFKHNGAWLPAAPLLQWLAALGIIYIFNEFPRWVWVSQGKLVATLIMSFGMLVTAIIAVVIGLQWGLEGICIALLLRTIAVFPVIVYVNYRLTGIPIRVFLTAIWPSIVAGILMAVTLLPLKTCFAGDTLQRHFLTLLVGALCGGAVYLLALRFLFRPAMRKLTETFRGMLPYRKHGVEQAG